MFRAMFVLCALCVLRGETIAAETGTITGTVDKPADVTKLMAINRGDDKRFPGEIDAKTGAFTIKNLPLGATYDLLFEIGADMKLEGVNLSVPHSDYEVEQPMTKEDVEAITEAAKSLNQFENNIEVMTVLGNIQHAAVVLNKTRTTSFVNQAPGEMIWRMEVWQFEKPDETWIKNQDDLFVVLHRERLQKADFDKKALTLDPALGGVGLSEKQANVELGKVVLPSKERGIRLRTRTAKDK
ncbi:MAG TPA: hypothetical protein DDY78_23900 [Planctomycetales bacterium]|jgi:hypothetical protein|nr:hypothetical protein [Planctomycetales bacterium]